MFSFGELGCFAVVFCFGNNKSQPIAIRNLVFVPYSAHASGKNHLTKDIEGVDRAVELEEKSTAAAGKQVK